MTNTTHPGCNQYGHAPGCGHVKDEAGLALLQPEQAPEVEPTPLTEAEKEQVDALATDIWKSSGKRGLGPRTIALPDGSTVVAEADTHNAFDHYGKVVAGGYRVTRTLDDGSADIDFYPFGYRRHKGSSDPCTVASEGYEVGVYTSVPGGISGIGVVCDGPVVARRVAEDAVRRARHDFEELDEDAFDERFGHIEAPDGNSVWDDPPTQYPENQIWTVVDVDGDLYLEPGYHVVNKVGYVVSEEPRDHENYTAEWFISHDEDDEWGEGD